MVNNNWHFFVIFLHYKQFEHVLYICLDGYYMYIEASGSRKLGDKAHLESPKVTADPSTKCLRFWYHMYGATIGQLNVYTRAGASLGPAIWTRQGTQGNKWIQGQVVINKTSDFTVSMEHLEIVLKY